MRLYLASAGSMVLAFALSAGLVAQGGPPQGGMPAGGQGGGARGGARQAAGGPDPARVIPGGGIFAAGWMGKIDAAEAANGQKLENSKLSMEGNALHVETGPA